MNKRSGKSPEDEGQRPEGDQEFPIDMTAGERRRQIPVQVVDPIVAQIQRRFAAEGARAEAEGARTEEEGARIEAEGARIAAEGARIAAEGARMTKLSENIEIATLLRDNPNLESRFREMCRNFWNHLLFFAEPGINKLAQLIHGMVISKQIDAYYEGEPAGYRGTQQDPRPSTSAGIMGAKNVKK